MLTENQLKIAGNKNSIVVDKNGNRYRYSGNVCWTRESDDKVFVMCQNGNFEEKDVFDGTHEIAYPVDVEVDFDDSRHYSCCPSCGSHDIEGGNFNSDSGYVWQNIECSDCGTSWKEIYSESGSEEFSVGR